MFQFLPGKKCAEDFRTTIYIIDSNAAALVIADIEFTEIVGNNKGWFSQQYSGLFPNTNYGEIVIFF